MIEPVYDADGVTLYAGRCENVMPRLTGTVDAVLADLPYQTTTETWDRVIDPKILWHLYGGLAGPRVPIVLFGSGMFAAQMMVSNPALFRYDLVWDKDAITGHLNAKRQPLRCHEKLLVFYRQQPYYDPQMVYTGRSSHSRGSTRERTNRHYGHYENTDVVDQGGFQHPRSILRFPRPKLPKGMGHPTQKPVALMEWLVRSYTPPGALILDNVCGSATTLVAARKHGRRAIGIEMNPAFVEMAINRLTSGSEDDRW